jgi:hypothetical protein
LVAKPGSVANQIQSNLIDACVVTPSLFGVAAASRLLPADLGGAGLLADRICRLPLDPYSARG